MPHSSPTPPRIPLGTIRLPLGITPDGNLRVLRLSSVKRRGFQNRDELIGWLEFPNSCFQSFFCLHWQNHIFLSVFLLHQRISTSKTDVEVSGCLSVLERLWLLCRPPFSLLFFQLSESSFQILLPFLSNVTSLQSCGVGVCVLGRGGSGLGFLGGVFPYP